MTAATPSEGASDVDPSTDVVSITFSELMDTTAGSLSIDGGASLGAVAWNGETASVSLSGLAPEASYRIVFSGFVDLAGVALDGGPFLGDGALDFATGPAGADVTPPRVTDADPNEGQVDVAIDLAAITVTFDEPMNTDVTMAVLNDGTASQELVGSWDGAGATITFPLASSLAYGTAHRVDLSAFTDVAGNLLDATTYLGDGALDFTTVENPDTTLPFVVSSDPTEGAFNLDPDMQVITVTFSEDMDATLTAVSLIEGSSNPEVVSGTWSDGDTLFTIDLTSYLTPGAVYHLDLTGLTDEAGNAVDTAHEYLGDGILDFALGNPSGDSCNEPLGYSQAVENAGAYTWTVAAGSVGSSNGQFACDATGHGSDVVIRYVKTSDTVANGGDLLHVSAVGGSDDINLEVTSGTCSATTGTVETCLWFKSSWDKFLDVPAGTYWIWVSDDDTSGGFPGATVTVEEIPPTAPQAEGEGCFAPYTAASAIYTAPPTANDFHTWMIPASINGFDIAQSSASVGSISCDDHATYGDIHGVDAVIEFQKTSATSVLLVEATNLDPTLTQSDLNVEVLTGCDTLEPATSSLYCGANTDNFAFTANAGVGPVYVWVSTEATGEEFNGAEVKIREFTPAIGETRGTAEPLTASGPINPTSAAGLDRPSCFPTTGNIHWYSYTMGDTLFGVKGDAAAAMAIVDGSGSEIACSTDTTGVAIGKFAPAGTTLYVAVESPTAIGNLTIFDQTYTGVVGNVTNLGITFPVSATTEYSMAVGTNEVFMGSTAEIWSFSKTGAAAAVEHNTGEGLGTTQLGYTIAFADGKLFSADSTTTATASRLFAVHDEVANTWGPTTWDLTPNYPASSGTYAMTSDGANLIMALRRTVVAPLTFMAVSPVAPSTPVTLGSYNGSVHYATGVAADAAYIYVAARESSTEEYLYRFDRADLTAAPLRLARINANTLHTAVAVDDLTAAGHVYVRDDDSVVHVIANVGATPIYLGALLTIGGTADYAMTVDPASNTMYAFDSTFATNGGIVEIQ